MTSPDIEWARRCATEYAQKPTDARARNSAQCLPGILALLDETRRAYDDLAGWRNNNADAPALRTPPELCHARHTADDGADLTCFLAAQHHGDHSTNAWPNQRTWPKNGWRRAGTDPCPARSHKRETCTKGYLHVGAHEWGTTKTIEAGPELPGITQPTTCQAARVDPYDHRNLTCILPPNHPRMHETAEPTLSWRDLEPGEWEDLSRQFAGVRKVCGDACTHHAPPEPELPDMTEA